MPELLQGRVDTARRWNRVLERRTRGDRQREVRVGELHRLLIGQIAVPAHQYRLSVGEREPLGDPPWRRHLLDRGHLDARRAALRLGLGPKGRLARLAVPT